MEPVNFTVRLTFIDDISEDEIDLMVDKLSDEVLQCVRVFMSDNGWIDVE